jgi:hypothetical protein
VAEPQLPGGAIEWARRVLGLADRAEARRVLERDFGTEARIPATPDLVYRDDWCRMPTGFRAFEQSENASPMQGEFAGFIKRQWGLSIADALRWELGFSLTGRHAWRVIIPVKMGGRIVGFQTRTIKDSVTPKYFTSQHGEPSNPQAECGRPASRMLFNVDAVRVNQEILMVEGAGDVMGWHSRPESSQLPAIGLLGLALTGPKLALISTARPRRVIVAPDQGARERLRALDHIDALRAWDVDAVLGEWEGAEDAGGGATLVVGEPLSLADRIRERLRR